jgi:hypothetical protein
VCVASVGQSMLHIAVYPIYSKAVCDGGYLLTFLTRISEEQPAALLHSLRRMHAARFKLRRCAEFVCSVCEFSFTVTCGACRWVLQSTYKQRAAAGAGRVEPHRSNSATANIGSVVTVYTAAAQHKCSCLMLQPEVCQTHRTAPYHSKR